MPKTTMSLWVGGAAGDGIASVGETFVKLGARSGLHAYAYNSYQSLIRGGHVLFQTVVAPEKVYTQSDDCDLLIALNQDAIRREAKDAVRGVLFNSDRLKLDAAALRPGCNSLGLPCMKLAPNPLMQNTVALGAAVKLSGLDFALLEGLLKETFRKKTAEVVAMNVTAARAGYEYSEKNFPDLDIRLPASGRQFMVMTGNQAIALGAASAGCKFFAGYPMTPASTVMHWISPRASKLGMVFKQAEDELAAMNMVVGAAVAGARSMTATAGGGFALMTEAMGLAAMVEAPCVVVEVQRGGPSTGLPTKTEQGDLFQVLGAGQGDYPKIVLAPNSMEDAYYATVEAFNLADRYQLPVVVMSDLLLSEHIETVEDLDMNALIDRGVWAVPGQNNGGVGYHARYLDTPNGVSPRAVPGQDGLMHVAASDEHDEHSNLISDVHTDPLKRIQMMNKRMRKMEYAVKDLKPVLLEGPADADLTIVGWGSTLHMMRHAMRHFNKGGAKRVNLLPVRNLHPFQSDETLKALKSAKKVLAMEVNYTGQLCRLIRMETGFDIPAERRMLKYDGEPFYPGSVIARVEEALHG